MTGAFLFQELNKDILSWGLCALPGSVQHASVRAWSCLTLCDPHGRQPARLLCPWNSLSKSTGVVCCFLFQGIFLTQRSKLSLLNWQLDSLPLAHLGSPSVPSQQIPAWLETSCNSGLCTHPPPQRDFAWPTNLSSFLITLTHITFSKIALNYLVLLSVHLFITCMKFKFLGNKTHIATLFLGI